MSLGSVGRRRRADAAVRTLRLLGAVLLAGIAVVHGHLWLGGYRTVDVVGPTVLLLAVLAVVGTLGMLAAPRPLLPAVATGGAAVAAGSLTALLVSTTVGLYDAVTTTSATLWWESFWLELIAFGALSVLAVLAGREQDPH